MVWSVYKAGQVGSSRHLNSVLSAVLAPARCSCSVVTVLVVLPDGEVPEDHHGQGEVASGSSPPPPPAAGTCFINAGNYTR